MSTTELLPFILFGLMLAGVAAFHKYSRPIAAVGSILVTLSAAFGLNVDLLHHATEEKNILLNLFLLIVGFELLALYFKNSHLPAIAPNYLPDNWQGGLRILILTFILSSFLDNIASAVIAGSLASVVFKKRVAVGFIAAIVAAANLGGTGSVIGDTTTTMMWIDGVDWTDVLHAYVGAFVAFLVIAIPASRAQHEYQPIIKDAPEGIRMDFAYLLIMGFILGATIYTNKEYDFPAAGLWAGIGLGSIGLEISKHKLLSASPRHALHTGSVFRKHTLGHMIEAVKGAGFLLSLVWAASLMPTSVLSRWMVASPETAFGLGFVSAVFDNIPLTKLALQQGGFDWGMLAYAVGYGGSITWFGSSAGVAITNEFPEARNLKAWLKGGWFIPVSYVLGFIALYLILGWHPHAPHK